MKAVVILYNIDLSEYTIRAKTVLMGLARASTATKEGMLLYTFLLALLYATTRDDLQAR